MQESTHYWNTLAPRWDTMLGDARTFPNHEEASRRFHWFMKRKVKIGNRTKTYRLLDLGCGTGEASWPLWKRVASVTFFDQSPTMLKVLRNKYEKGIFVSGDASRPPFIDEEFDVILSRGSIISQLPLERIPAFLSETWRILRPNGLLLFDFVSNMSSWTGESHIYHHQWTHKEMEALLLTHLPGATIEAWDGADLQATGRVLIRK